MVAEIESLDSIQNRKSDENDCNNGEQVDPARRSNTAATKSTHIEMMGKEEQRRDVTSSVQEVLMKQKFHPQQTQQEITEKGSKLQNNEKLKHHESNSSTKSLETSQQSKELNNEIPAKPNSLLESHDSDRDTIDRSNLPLSSGQFSPLTTNDLVTNKVPEKLPENIPLSKSDGEIVLHTESSASKIQNRHAANNSVKPECVNNSSKKPKGTKPSAVPTSQTAPLTQVKPSEPPTKDKTDKSNANEEANEARLPLVSRYGSFIHPTDTSLAEARKRLRIAIDQTRRLRIAFTERVYEKYRVILYPPPSSVEKIVDKITADPAGINSKLKEQIQELKEEKDVEKKEAQRLTAAGVFNTSHSNGKPVSSSSVETAEQLAYIGAGLSLVILPEQDIQDPEINLGRFQHRGPTNPETGQRVSGISQAAATAAEVLLDRVRRAATLRSERQRRQHLSSENTPGTASEQNFDSILSRYNLLSSVIPSKTTKMKAPERAQHVLVDQLSTQSKKPSKAPGMKRQQILNKHIRVPIQAGISGASMLTLEPLVEDLDSDGKISSSTAGLVLCGVGHKSNQPKWNNQYSELIDGRRLGTPAKTNKMEDLVNLQAESTTVNGMTNRYTPSSLLQTNMEESVHLPVMDREKIETIRAKKAVHLILSQFVPTDDDIDIGTNFDVKSPVAEKRSSIDKNSSIKSKSNRRATEIGLMHGLEHSIPKEKSNHKARESGQHCSVTENLPMRPSEMHGHVETFDIEPIVAFSVLQAVGLITDTPSSQNESQPIVPERLLNINHSSLQCLSPTRTGSSERLYSIYSKAISKKRTFTEAFESHFSLSTAESVNSLPHSNVPHEKKVDPKLDTASNKAQHIQEVVLESSSKELDNCPVVSMRGGGNDGNMGTTQGFLGKKNLGAPGSSSFDKAVDGSNSEKVEASTRPKSAPDTTHSPSRALNSSRPSSSSSAPIHSSSTEGLYSVLAQNRVNNGPHGPTYPQQGNGHFGLASGAVGRSDVTDRIQAQAHQLQLHAAAMNGLSQGGEISDFLNANLHQRSGFTGRPDWSAMQQTRQSAVNLMPSHSSIALGMNPHQAAMLELSARDRAARALLAREQQAAIHAAAVHRQQQQAAALMNAQASQAGGGIFSTSSAARYNQLGPHSAATAAAILSSPAAAAALIGQTQIASGTLSGPIMVGQHSDSRPSSQHSTSSNKSGKGKRPSSRGRREVRDENTATKATEPIKIQTQPKLPGTSSKRKASELSLATTLEEPQTIKVAIPKEPEMKKVKPNSNGVTRISSLISINESKKAKLKEIRKVPCKELKTLEPNDRKMHNQSPTNEKLGVDSVVAKEVVPEIQSPKPEKSTPGMQFFPPPTPPTLDSKMISFVLEGRIHISLRELFESSGNLGSAAIATAMLDYLQAIGSSVPIPKALISNPLRERLNAQSVKTIGNGGSNTPNIPRDLLVAVILVWLWMQHKDTFRRAFAKSGRIDVDPECKWLIHAAVDAVSRAIISELVDASENGGPLASAMSSSRSKGGTTKVISGNEGNNFGAASTALDCRLTMIASKALMTELRIDEGVDSVLVMYEDFVKLIDETRIQSLRAKCVERVLLASLVSKHSTMPESFAHAYVSSMVRAGEALGHGELFELVQDEDVSASTMIPYDIFSDETGAWEDPCRPINGFSPNLTGEDLVRQAHARAMIVKSLKKMQDRNNIKGGTPVAGPYLDKITKQAQAEDIKGGKISAGSARRRSASWTDNSTKLGIRPARGINEAHYHPRHVSTPLFWDENAIENLPYGKYENGNRPRAFSTNSLSPGNEESSADCKHRGNLPSTATQQSHAEVAGQGESRRSTEEVSWSEVACVFKIVNIGGPVTTSRRRTSKLSPQPVEQPRNPLPKTIIAPFCNRIDEQTLSSSESDSEEEDITDHAILARHTVVLNKMKERLDKFMEGRTTAGQRARQRSKQRANEKITLLEKKTGSPR